MKCFIKILWLICFCVAGGFAQQIGQIPTRKLVEVPRELTLQVIAVQPNCPIKFEDVHFLAGVEGGFGNSYRLRNIGTKPIRSVTIASSNGAGGTYANKDNILMPGELIPETINCKGCREDEIVPLTDELREKLNLKGSMQSIVALMVVEVEFTDGTKYSDEKTYKAMTDYFDKLSDALEEQKQRSAKQP